jgi:asparagine synthase (glutamine-hydrolysing)
MCGISGFSGTSLPEGLERSLAAIHHRGPDDRGFFVSESRDCFLGNVRLAIQDLSPAGHQPMADASGRYWLAYNGEVYNFRELRMDLERRHGAIAWRGHSDTEVIVEGFAREGFAFLSRLNGIFALALYDTRERLTHLLRDPLGIKPLFITRQAGGVYFCSELKGLLTLPQLKRTIRLDAFAEQLAFMYVPEPLTPFEEFSKAPPGVCFTVAAGREVSAQPLYQHLDDREPFTSDDDAITTLRATLKSAVQRQLISDAPVSLFLSGGLDSSAVAHFAVEGGATVNTAYTISFADSDRKLDEQGDDLGYARLMADRLGLSLTVIEADQRFLQRLPELMPFMEDGFSDPSAINTFLICEAARNAGVKVMLSGQGADEYLGGYRRYRAEMLLERAPRWSRRALAMAGRTASSAVRPWSNAASRRLGRLASVAGKSTSDRLLDLYTWTRPELIQALLAGRTNAASAAAFQSRFGINAHRDIREAMMRVDQHYDLMSLNLCYTDRMSMAASVEARVPFLDFELVRVMNALSPSLKVRGRQGKFALKKAMEPLLPHDVIYRPKAGFGLPLRAWLRGNKDWLSQYFAPERIRRQGIFDSDALQRVMQEQFTGKADHAYTVFTLMCQQLWLERHA